LTVAGADVLAGERTLLDIAVRYGYGSAEAFGRAFRAVHGIGPGEARRTGASLHAQPRMSFRLTVEGSNRMRYRLVDKDGCKVVGKRARVGLVHEGLNPAIVSFVRSIDKLTLERLESLSDQEPRGIVAVVDDLADGRGEGTELDYYHGVVTSAAAPDDLDVLEVEPGTWAVIDHLGIERAHDVGASTSSSVVGRTRDQTPRHTAGLAHRRYSCGDATPSVLHQRHIGRVLRSSCNSRGRRLASSRGREPQPGRCASLWPGDVRDDGGSVAAAGADGSET
jgi:predicted transcriptional regulator YdeE